MSTALHQTTETLPAAHQHYKRNPVVPVEGAAAPGARRRRGAEACLRLVLASVFYTVAALYFTWPLVTRFGTATINHIDPPFSAWRLWWVAKQLTRGAPALFEGNIFWPAHRTLAFSDAMLVQGALAVPLTALRLSPVAMVNLLTLAAMVTSALAAYLLARRLTGHTGAALLAGLVFAFSPFRLDHLAHLELQWACWMPLAFWAWHRTLDHGRFGDGLLCVGFVLMQLLSSIYYGIFLGVAMAVLALLTLAGRRFRLAPRALAGLAVGAVILGVTAAEYARPYRQVELQLGPRTAEETRRYSATPLSFVSTRPDNRVYGDLTGRWQEEEKRLNPGLTPVVLAASAFVPTLASGAAAYGGVLAFSAEMALGLNGRLFPVLRDAFPAFRGFRAPARFGILVQLALCVLTAMGLARLARRWPRAATPLVGLTIALTVVEYSAEPRELMSLPATPPPIYRWLALQPRGIVTLELPTPRADGLPHMDPFYMYQSIWHGQPLVNGYSGHYYPGYIGILRDLASFSGSGQDQVLVDAGVQLLILHQAFLPTERWNVLVESLDVNPRFRLIKIADDSVGEARAYIFLPNYRPGIKTEPPASPPP
jgi:hypothetical protein